MFRDRHQKQSKLKKEKERKKNYFLANLEAKSMVTFAS